MPIIMWIFLAWLGCFVLVLVIFAINEYREGKNWMWYLSPGRWPLFLTFAPLILVAICVRYLNSLLGSSDSHDNHHP